MTSLSPSKSCVPLLPAVAAGERDAMEACLQRYEGFVWALARRFFGSTVEAEDAVQEAFIELWRSAGRFDPARGAESTFVTTIARRRMIDLRRRQIRRADAPAGEEAAIEETVPAPESGDASMDDDGRRALALVRGLPPEQRRMLEWSLADGLSHTEIAEKTGTPLGTVKTLIRRGLMRVRDGLRLGGEDVR